MKQGYFAFYWTFPVPWVGFTSLPDTVDEAETISRTIRYSRAQVRAHVAQVGGEILPGGEVACIELAPDRGSPEIGAELERFLIRAEAAGAMVAIVDFSGHDGWRGHQFLSRHYDHPRCDVIRASYEACIWLASTPTTILRAGARVQRPRLRPNPITGPASWPHWTRLTAVRFRLGQRR